MFKNMQVTGLDLPNLLDVAPSLRMAFAKALQLEPGKEHNKRSMAIRQKGRNVDMVSETDVYAILRARDKVQGVIHGVLPEPRIRFFNFHTDGEGILHDIHVQDRKEVKKNHLDKILIDRGVVVNLMPEDVARRLGLRLTENSDILICTATNEIRCVKYCTKFDVRIAGVTAAITVHVLDIPQSYSLLLGQRWLYQVRAIDDYEAQSYTIFDAEGIPHQMSSIAGTAKGPDVLLNPSGGPGLTEQEKEEIKGQEKMQALLAKVTSEAKEQILEYEDDYGDDEDDDNEEDCMSSGEEPPKVQRQ